MNMKQHLANHSGLNAVFCPFIKNGADCYT